MEGSSAVDRKFAAGRAMLESPRARPETPTHIVKWVGRDAPEQERKFFAATDEAEQFAIGLVRAGDALPDDIQIFQNTGIVVRVSCEYPPKAPTGRG